MLKPHFSNFSIFTAIIPSVPIFIIIYSNGFKNPYIYNDLQNNSECPNIYNNLQQ